MTARRGPVTPTQSDVHILCEMYLCAWCDRKMRRAPGNLRGKRTVKHGICPRCLKQQLAQLMSLPAPQEAHRRDQDARAA